MLSVCVVELVLVVLFDCRRKRVLEPMHLCLSLQWLEIVSAIVHDEFYQTKLLLKKKKLN